MKLLNYPINCIDYYEKKISNNKFLITGAESLIGQGVIKLIKNYKYSFKIVGADYFKISTGLFWCNKAYISNWFSSGGWSVRLYAKDTKIEFNPLENGIYTNSKYKKIRIKPNKVDIKFKPGFYNQIKSFIYLIKSKKNIYPSQNLEEIVKTFETINIINK